MTAAQKKKPLQSFPKAKIARIVRGILPEGQEFEIRTTDSGIREKKVVRIVTPAWKNLRPPERIFKVLDAMDRELSAAEQSRILRFSVLTPSEYREVVADDPSPGRSPASRAIAAKKLAAKRKANQTAPARRRHPAGTP